MLKTRAENTRAIVAVRLFDGSIYPEIFKLGRVTGRKLIPGIIGARKYITIPVRIRLISKRPNPLDLKPKIPNTGVRKNVSKANPNTKRTCDFRIFSEYSIAPTYF